MNEKGDVTDSILGWIQDHDIAELAHDTERGQVAQRLATLRAEVARQGEALRALISGGAGVTLGQAEAARLLAALGASAPDAGLGQWVTGGGTLDVMPWGWRCGVCGSSGTGWHRGHRCRPFAPLPEPVGSAVGVLRYEACQRRGDWDVAPALSAEYLLGVADALAAFWRAQQQPALDADVREAMLAACYVMRQAANSGCLPIALADDLADAAARLRELAGEPDA